VLLGTIAVAAVDLIFEGKNQYGCDSRALTADKLTMIFCIKPALANFMPQSRTYSAA